MLKFVLMSGELWKKWWHFQSRLTEIGQIASCLEFVCMCSGLFPHSPAFREKVVGENYTMEFFNKGGRIGSIELQSFFI